MPRDKIRERPRISVNKLGEYLTANASRRQRIITEQKRPRDFIVARYADAQDAASRFLVSPTRDAEILYSAIAALGERPTDTVWQVETNILCAEALESFIECIDELEIEDVRTTAASQEFETLAVGGVSISVRPEVIVSRRVKDREYRGAIKLYFSKTNPLSTEAAAYVSSLVHQRVVEAIRPPLQGDYRLTAVVDVFARTIHRAPRTATRRLRDVNAACREIARAWPEA